MQLPVGMLIFWAKREDDKATIVGPWYYKEMYVPSTVEEKKNTILDFKNKRTTLISISGKFEQIKEILFMSDKFMEASSNDIFLFNSLLAGFEKSSTKNPYYFDDINNLKGTALSLDTSIEVDETFENIQQLINKGNLVDVNITDTWSYQNEFFKALGVECL